MRIAAIAAATSGGVAHADKRQEAAQPSAQLATQLGSKASAKVRLSAAIGLARLGDINALSPLMAALSDESHLVRAVAAAALGRMGYKAALPALDRATSDSNAMVAARAREAAIAVRKANANIADKAKGAAGFGTVSRALQVRPDLFVVIKSASDDSAGPHDKKARLAHTAILRETMQRKIAAAPTLTSGAAEAERYDLDLRNVDLSVVKMEHRTLATRVEVEVQLRLAISDGTGRMMSFLSGGAMVQVPRRTFQASYLPQLRREALTSAVDGIFDKLVGHLRRSAGS